MQHTMRLLCATVLLLATSALAFKGEDFKNCADAAFCQRLRGQSSSAFAIDPKSVTIQGSQLKATVLNKEDSNGTFVLSVTAYDGIVRLYMNEPEDKDRFQVPDVLIPGFDKLEKGWEVVKHSGKKAQLRLGDATADLNFNPLSLTVAVGGKPVLTWNNDKQLIFEHRREKQEGDPEGWWEEEFKGHSDSKKRGPESISFDVRLHGYDHVYGLPERAAPLSLRETRHPNGTFLTEPYRLYNLDVFEYLDDSPFGLYGSIPLLLAHRVGQTTGVFWLNSAEMYVDVERPGGSVGTQWIAESGIIDMFVLLGPSPADITRQYAALTGGTALPNIFALGYHQCRWNYKDEEDVKNVDAGFDEYNIPYDVIWLDIEHTDGKKYFSWDKAYFPTPIEMQQGISAKRRKMVTIVDPHIKRDTTWELFKEAEDQGLYVQNKDGGDFDGWCWPGSSSYLDMTRPEVRSWWSDRFSTEKYVGSTRDLYIWNDMNEPSVFNGPEITMPKDNLHINGYEHRDVHNVYGYFYHMATADGLRRRGFQEWGPDGDRPFVLSRAFFSGTQRIGAIWTGDNSAEWSHLEVSVPMLLTLGISGLPFAGADIGGFFGNPDAELATRWYQAGAYNPFFRGHAHLETARREPWLFGDEATTRIREAFRERYRLLPHIYTLFMHANVSGSPVMRPLWYEFPDDKDTFDEDKIFMVGSSLLVAPVLQQGAEQVPVFLPGNGMWYHGSTGAAIDSSIAANRKFNLSVTMDTVPKYYRGGSMTALKERPRRSTAAMATDPVTLIIALDKQGTAVGDLYLDDGRSFAFQRGQYAYQTFTYAADGTLTAARKPLELGGLPPSDPEYDPQVLVDRIVVLGVAGGPEGWAAQAVAADGTTQQLEAAPGSITLQRGVAELALVVRRPQLPAHGNWTIKFSKTPGKGGAVSK